MTRANLQDVVKTTPDCDKDGCCSAAEDGSAICKIETSQSLAVDASACRCDSTGSGCGCQPTTTHSIVSIQTLQTPSSARNSLRARLEECKTVWGKIRGGVMFVVACIASPCCTPLIVPIVLTLLAGTPMAVWMGQNLGWVYGGLTALSVVSFVVALRWMGKNNRVRTLSSGHQALLNGDTKTEISSQSL